MRLTRILVVDDSVVARRVISDILSEEADFEVVGTAPNGKIYAIGGYNPDESGHGYLATVEEYDPETDTWTARAPMPTPRYGLAAAI